MDATKQHLLDRRPVHKLQDHIANHTLSAPIPMAFTLPDYTKRGFQTPPKPKPQLNIPFTKKTPAPPRFSATTTTTYIKSPLSAGSKLSCKTPKSLTRTSTVRRIARTLFEWNLGPQTDLTQWQSDGMESSEGFDEISGEISEQEMESDDT